MTNDLNAVRMLLGPGLMYSANTVFLTVFALVFMLRISPYLTLVALAPMPIASILVQYFGSRIHTRFERIQASFSDISAQAQENYSGARWCAHSPAKSPRSVSLNGSTASTSAAPFALSSSWACCGHARVRSRRLHDHHLAGRRPPGHLP